LGASEGLGAVVGREKEDDETGDCKICVDVL